MSRQGNIYLIGFSGTGKTISGIKAAEILRLPFVDMDELIQYRTRKSIPQIFQEDGEEAFRKMETEIIQELARKDSRVVSTGGGVPTVPINREIMQDSGIILLLTASPETIHKRLDSRSNADRTLRPLLGENAPIKRVRTLLESRTEAYSCAHRTIDTENISYEQVAEAIVQAWNEMKQLRTGAGDEQSQ